MSETRSETARGDRSRRGARIVLIFGLLLAPGWSFAQQSGPHPSASAPAPLAPVAGFQTDAVHTAGIAPQRPSPVTAKPVAAALPSNGGGAPASATRPIAQGGGDLGATQTRSEPPADLSITGMFKSAHIVVKVVMGILASASVVTWAIWLYKCIELAVAKSRASDNLRAIAAAGNLAAISRSVIKGPVARLVQAAELEMNASETLRPDGIKERVALALQRVEIGAARRIGIGTGVLASIGSTGPFVGLFGTVWGIMNSFINISNSHTTNLSVVAPGIAEALLATAMGLVAAIPAVVIYNVFSRAIAGYRVLLGDASAAIMRHVSRDLDRARAREQSRVAAE